ncbi:MAG: Flp pilus assembly complex ATPase component TadA [Lysobacter sp.]|nr:Flp pilus assembly complex ATPase component TadA [Lysobacter sp.]
MDDKTEVPAPTPATARATREWPLPPMLNQVTPEAAGARVECRVLMAHGGRMAGALKRFEPGAGRLSVLAEGENSESVLELDLLRSVSLPVPLAVRPREVPLTERGGAVFPHSERQVFFVEFTDGEHLTGETMGHVLASCGLFLYEPHPEGGVVRLFFPKAALRGHRIGLPIGEMLVRDNLVASADVLAAVDKQRDLRRQRIGDYLASELIVTREQLEAAIVHQEGRPLMRIGEALIQLGLINDAQLRAALERQAKDRGKPLGRILTEMGLVAEDQMREALARKLGIPFVGLAGFNFDPVAISLVGSRVARRRSLIPLCLHDGAIVVAFEDPLDAAAVEDVRFLTQRRVIPAMAAREEIAAAIAAQYGSYGASAKARLAAEETSERHEYEFHRASDVDVDRLAASLRVEDKALAIADDSQEVAESALVQLVNKMILDAWRDGVSDIHVESNPEKLPTLIRFRKDGTLVDYLELPAGSRNALISRIKVMSQLDISERRKPQDGKINFRQFGPADIELRVATIPTNSGLEDVVMRLLAGSKSVPMGSLGLAPASLQALERIMSRPYGLVIVCGPTGSGKTTTLHSLLSSINKPGRKIWTAEDPIEITQPGLRQVQVHAKIGWTFAAALRSFLRADPDVIMVGEMRDTETTRAGIEASLTGHLVLSTLHTNSAPESIVRLLDLGMDPFNFADALLAVLAQRLPKALCPHCREPRGPGEDELEDLAAEYCEGTSLAPGDVLARWHGTAKLYRAPGCVQCNGTGHLGRIGIHELLVMTPTLRHLVQTRAPLGELVRAAQAGGMVGLKQDGIEKVLAGLTDIGNVRAVCL